MNNEESNLISYDSKKIPVMNSMTIIKDDNINKNKGNLVSYAQG